MKLAIRNLYQAFFDLVPQKAERSAYPITCREGFYFGFHDHSPFSFNNQYLAAGNFDLEKPIHMPESGEELSLGVFTGENYTQWTPITTTRAWNWHQGCKLQWCGNRDELVFNDHVSGRNVARVVPVGKPDKEMVLPGPIGSVSPSGEWAVGYSFERVEKYMPGYGYRYETDREDLEAEAPETDGIYMSNISKQTRDLIIDLKRLRYVESEASMDGAHHYVSHTIFSPSSKRFVFLHRWMKGDVTKRWSRIVTSDLNGENLRVFPTLDMASHLGWRDENELLVYCRLRDGNDCYALFQDESPVTYAVMGAESFNSDGHPAWSPDRRYFITDTYPDRFRQQYLALYDSLERKRYNLAKVKTYKKFATLDPYRHWACDLHPRWDRTGRYVCFDATYSGQRSLCTIDLGSPVSELETIEGI